MLLGNGRRKAERRDGGKEDWKGRKIDTGCSLRSARLYSVSLCPEGRGPASLGEEGEEGGGNKEQLRDHRWCCKHSGVWA